MKTLNTKTISKKMMQEIKSILPTASGFKKKHIAGCGYVLFVYGSNGITIAHATKTVRKGFIINIK